MNNEIKVPGIVHKGGQQQPQGSESPSKETAVPGSVFPAEKTDSARVPQTSLESRDTKVLTPGNHHPADRRDQVSTNQHTGHSSKDSVKPDSTEAEYLARFDSDDAYEDENVTESFLSQSHCSQSHWFTKN